MLFKNRLTGVTFFIIGLILITLLAVTNNYIYQKFDVTVDDAYISFKYSNHLASGDGLVWNPGEKVEGFTNFLWTIIMSLGELCGINVPMFSKILGIVSAFGVIFTLFYLTRHITQKNTVIVLIPSFLISINIFFLEWALSGLETVFFTMLITLGAYFLASKDKKKRNIYLSGIFFALSAMTRPEGIIFFAFAVFYLFIWFVLTKKVTLLLKFNDLYKFILSFLVIFVPYFIIRYSYFGYPLPNTFYAKVGFTHAQILRGIEFFEKYGLDHVVLLSFIIGLFSIKNIKKEPITLLFWVNVIFYSIYVIAVGGDHFGARFVVPILPSLFILAALGVNELLKFRGKIVNILLAILVTLFAGFSINNISTRLDSSGFNAVRAWVSAGQWLKSKTTFDEFLAIDAAGAIPYYSGANTIDILGLNDLYIAHKTVPNMGKGMAGHEKSDPNYVFFRNPEYISLWLTDNGAPGFLGYNVPNIQKFILDNYKLVAAFNMREEAPILENPQITPELFNKGYQYGIFKKKINIDDQNWLNQEIDKIPSDKKVYGTYDIKPLITEQKFVELKYSFDNVEQNAEYFILNVKLLQQDPTLKNNIKNLIKNNNLKVINYLKDSFVILSKNGSKNEEKSADFLNDLNLYSRYNASELNSIGNVIEAQDQERTSKKIKVLKFDGKPAIIYGPYITLEPGEYKVKYYLRKGTASYSNNKGLKLDVASDFSKNILAERQIDLTDLSEGSYQPIELNFVIEHSINNVEFRTMLLNEGEALFDKIEVIKIK